MSTIEEKKAMIQLKYYDEYNRESAYCKNMQFLGIDYNGYPIMIFRLSNGNTVFRQLFDELTYREISK